jgi:hypothetical protein
MLQRLLRAHWTCHGWKTTREDLGENDLIGRFLISIWSLIYGRIFQISYSTTRGVHIDIYIIWIYNEINMRYKQGIKHQKKRYAERV